MQKGFRFEIREEVLQHCQRLCCPEKFSKITWKSKMILGDTLLLIRLKRWLLQFYLHLLWQTMFKNTL